MRRLRTKEQAFCTTTSLGGSAAWIVPSAEFREWSPCRPRRPAHPPQLLHLVAESVYQHGIALLGVPMRLSLDRCCCTSGNASPSCHPLQPHIVWLDSFLINSNGYPNPTLQLPFSCPPPHHASAAPFSEPCRE